MMKPIFFALALLVTGATISSCTNDGIVQDFGDMAGLRDSLQHYYPDEKIRMQLNNGNALDVIFLNSKLAEVSAMEQMEVAKRVGTVTKQFFPPERIDKGSLLFVNQTNFIVFKTKEVVASYALDIGSAQ